MSQTDATPTRPMATVDIIMRTKDRLSLLPRAIASVRAQSFTDWNLVLVDSGDHEATRAWLHQNPGKAGERIQHVTVAPGPKMGELSNIGIREGNAPYIALLDDDDTWEPGFLAATCPVLMAQDKSPTCRGVVTRTMIVHEEFRNGIWEETSRKDLNPQLTRVTLPALAAVNRFTTNAFVYEREAWAAIGGYSPNMPVLDDWDFNLRFLLSWDVACIPAVFAYWHRRPATDSAADNSKACDHEFETACYINRHVRGGLHGEATPLSNLLLAGELHRLGTENQSRILGKIASMSDKVGKINSRTKQMLGKPS